MESLPPELHTLILELACASFPGSQTPRALALTSTHFHAIAAPFLFCTIAVSSQEQATPLLALLAAAPAHQRRIHRLFIGPALTSSTVLRLVAFAAPTVYDLAVVATTSSLLAALFRIHLPQLKALSVHGFYPLPRPGAFPTLTYLHVAGNHSPAGLPAALARACPALTRLRVSSLRGAPAFARELRATLGADDGAPLPLMESVRLEAQADAGGKKSNKVAQARDVEMRDILRTLGTSVRSPENSRAPRVEFLDKVDEDAEGMKSAWLTLDCP
ncbi:hypothetical protein FB451DRAFT_1227780 [Mycena latifolia]|nr:hypothetical protein FB451DRAFT_1227780 [Mycena latifolia]